MKKICLLLVMGFGLFLFTGCTDTVDDIIYPYPDSKDVKISLAQYNQIENGMTTSEVWDILGGKCTETSNSKIEGIPGVMDDIETILYGCNGSGSVGANAILTFKKDKLTLKAQHGLK